MNPVDKSLLEKELMKHDHPLSLNRKKEMKMWRAIRKIPYGLTSNAFQHCVNLIRDYKNEGYAIALSVYMNDMVPSVKEALNDRGLKTVKLEKDVSFDYDVFVFCPRTTEKIEMPSGKQAVILLFGMPFESTKCMETYLRTLESFKERIVIIPDGSLDSYLYKITRGNLRSKQKYYNVSRAQMLLSLLVSD